MATLPVYRRAEEIPELGHTFPLAIRSLHQIELTSRCNLRCAYCPSPQIVAGLHPGRPAVDLSMALFERALEHVAHYVQRGTQSDLNLAGIGESTIHPEFVAMIRRAREKLGRSVGLLLATNGLEVAKEDGGEALADALRESGVGCWVSLHRPEKAGIAIERLKARGVLMGVSADPSINADDWAGQVKWHRSQPYVSACMWLREGKAMVLADGRVTTCCLDATGAGVVGHVEDAIGTLKVAPYPLCRTCQQMVRVANYEQRG